MVNGQRQQGFTFVAALIAVAIASVVSMRGMERMAQSLQRERETELMQIGLIYRHAIADYYEHTPGTEKRYPPDLAALLDDARQTKLQRPLRRMYPDPITARLEWGQIRGPDGGVMGIYSLSERVPIKTGGFAPDVAQFAGATSYRDWQFIYLPGS